MPPTALTAPSLSLPTAHTTRAKPAAEVLSSLALTELCQATRGELHAWPDAEPPAPIALSKCLRGFGKLCPRERGRQSGSWGTGVRAGAGSCPSLLTVLSSNLSAACVHRTPGAYWNIAGICQAPVWLERSTGRSPISLTNSKKSTFFFFKPQASTWLSPPKSTFPHVTAVSRRGSLRRVSSTNVIPLPFAAPLAVSGRAQHCSPEPSTPSPGLPPQRASPLRPPVPAPARSHLAGCRPGRVFGNLCQQGTSCKRSHKRGYPTVQIFTEETPRRAACQREVRLWAPNATRSGVPARVLQAPTLLLGQSAPPGCNRSRAGCWPLLAQLLQAPGGTQKARSLRVLCPLSQVGPARDQPQLGSAWRGHREGGDAPGGTRLRNSHPPASSKGPVCAAASQLASPSCKQLPTPMRVVLQINAQLHLKLSHQVLGTKSRRIPNGKTKSHSSWALSTQPYVLIPSLVFCCSTRASQAFIVK